MRNIRETWTVYLGPLLLLMRMSWKMPSVRYKCKFIINTVLIVDIGGVGIIWIIFYDCKKMFLGDEKMHRKS